MAKWYPEKKLTDLSDSEKRTERNRRRRKRKVIMKKIRELNKNEVS